MKRACGLTKRPRGRPRKAPLERPAEPLYLTLDEFCVLIRVSRRTWQRHKPYLRTIKLGNRTLVARTEAERYIESLTQPAALQVSK